MSIHNPSFCLKRRKQNQSVQFQFNDPLPIYTCCIIYIHRITHIRFTSSPFSPPSQVATLLLRFLDPVTFTSCQQLINDRGMIDTVHHHGSQRNGRVGGNINPPKRFYFRSCTFWTDPIQLYDALIQPQRSVTRLIMHHPRYFYQYYQICTYVYINVCNTSMAWREVYKYLSIRIKENEFGCLATPRLSHWISLIPFFFSPFFYLC